MNDSGLTLSSKNDEILNKYVGYYLLFNQNNIYNLARGGAQKNLDMEKFKCLKIPIPSVSMQNKIITFLENLYNSYDDIQNTINHYEIYDIFKLLLTENFTHYNYLVIAQNFNIKIIELNDVLIISEELLNLQKIKNNIISKINISS